MVLRVGQTIASGINVMCPSHVESLEQRLPGPFDKPRYLLDIFLAFSDDAKTVEEVLC